MIDIERVGIVGAGTMGRRIAFGCIIEGLSARLYDTEASALAEARADIGTLLDEWVEAGRLGPGLRPAAVSMFSTHTSLSDCVEGVDLVVEAVPEDVELKRKVFAQIDEAAAPDTLLVTNSSSIPGSELADATDRPEQVANVNFGPPEDRKVEVMSHPDTAPATMEAVAAFIRRLGLVPIRVQREIMGYAVNRIWRAVKKETLFLLDGGYATPEDIDRGWMLEWDAPMGPCGLMDKVGLDVVRDIEQTYYEESGDPSDRPPQLLHDMIEAGKLGEKTGEGFYSYPDPAYEQEGWLEGEGDA
jgi:3-hydroxybutyryl-CoA dehydrogenase